MHRSLRVFFGKIKGRLPVIFSTFVCTSSRTSSKQVTLEDFMGQYLHHAHMKDSMLTKAAVLPNGFRTLLFYISGVARCFFFY